MAAAVPPPPPGCSHSGIKALSDSEHTLALNWWHEPRGNGLSAYIDHRRRRHWPNALPKETLLEQCTQLPIVASIWHGVILSTTHKASTKSGVVVSRICPLQSVALPVESSGFNRLAKGREAVMYKRYIRVLVQCDVPKMLRIL